MQQGQQQRERGAVLQTPVRNHYFYGQLLGVESFELETGYEVGQRRMLNRLVLGCGVVCGLGIDLLPDGRRIAVERGLAIDGWGREIVVPRRTDPIEIPQQVIDASLERAGDCPEDACVQVVICYHECLGDPQPELAGDCQTADPCVPSTIRERYRIAFRDHCERYDEPCASSGAIRGRRIDHDRLAWWVTYERDCGRPPRDPCIPLANLGVFEPEDETARCHHERVDIGVRPVVWSNVLLRELVADALGRDRDDEGRRGEGHYDY
jgi:hypothetical protein